MSVNVNYYTRNKIIPHKYNIISTILIYPLILLPPQLSTTFWTLSCKFMRYLYAWFCYKSWFTRFLCSRYIFARHHRFFPRYLLSFLNKGYCEKYMNRSKQIDAYYCSMAFFDILFFHESPELGILSGIVSLVHPVKQAQIYNTYY